MMALSEAAAALGARVSGRDVTFTGVSTDSRSIGKGIIRNQCSSTASAASVPSRLADVTSKGVAPILRAWWNSQAQKSVAAMTETGNSRFIDRWRK